MRFIRFIIISLIVLFLVFFAISLAIPSHIRISRAIDISSTKQKVFDAVNDFKAWDKWNQFIKNAPLTNKTFSDPSLGNGAFMKTDQLNISIIQSNIDSVKTKWDQTTGRKFDGGFNIMELRSGTITVQYYYDFYFRWYPWEKFTSLVYDHQLGTIMEESLTNLKQISESNP